MDLLEFDLSAGVGVGPRYDHPELMVSPSIAHQNRPRALPLSVPAWPVESDVAGGRILGHLPLQAASASGPFDGGSGLPASPPAPLLSS